MEGWSPASGKATHPQSLTPRPSGMSSAESPLPRGAPSSTGIETQHLTPNLGRLWKWTSFQVWPAKVIWGLCPGSKSPLPSPASSPRALFPKSTSFNTQSARQASSQWSRPPVETKPKQALVPSFT